MDLALFTYDREHWKTERFLFELDSLGYRPAVIYAAPWKTLDLPPTAILSVKHEARHPRELADRFGIPYEVRAHERIDRAFDLGIIGGARILPKKTLDLFRVGVINTHPGLIPENRGLSNIARAIRDQIPQAVTAHLVDERIDAGRILESRRIKVDHSDTIFDVAERIMDTQVAILDSAIQRAFTGDFETTVKIKGGYEPPLTRDQEHAIVDAWERR